MTDVTVRARQAWIALDGVKGAMEADDWETAHERAQRLTERIKEAGEVQAAMEESNE